ncbi:hypothetical protein LPJ73_000401 [Coemansia sp. RSA 2703]|nr:hypothetical protein LPJ73_000401 [Coemansia sp. RSA 2703]KAJ2377589.1 hypothetical protein IW150_001292 [Coemansia sp. RSA 2607]KAJ2398168.1 hypothetical protein GGI05_000255 [Coemansia sp. RSA 2603]
MLSSLVSASQLHANLNSSSSNVKVLDCSWHLPSANRSARAEFSESHIPGAQFFDIDGIKDLSKADLPHMLPPATFFGSSMDRFGISNSDHVVLYDTWGVGPACRVLWTFHAMGHEKVSVLNGGLAAWTKEGYTVTKGEPSDSHVGGQPVYQPNEDPLLVCSYADVVGNIEQLKSRKGEGKQIVDARPHARFTGEAPEPRAGLSSGHMPNSISVPASEMTKMVDGVQVLKSPEEIRKVFEDRGVDLSRPVITSCGSGVTAAILYFALLNAGVPRDMLTLYDGSWTEYALNPHSEIVKD